MRDRIVICIELRIIQEFGFYFFGLSGRYLYIQEVQKCARHHFESICVLEVLGDVYQRQITSSPP